MIAPVKMKYKSGPYEEAFDVIVYDFYHTQELESFALCWVPSKKYWVTAPIFTLTPISSKTTLNENKSVE